MSKSKATTVQSFEFDRDGNCTNPQVIHTFDGKIVTIQITAAQNRLGWDAGYSLDYKVISDKLWDSQKLPTINRSFTKRSDAIYEVVGELIKEMEEDNILLPAILTVKEDIEYLQGYRLGVASVQKIPLNERSENNSPSFNSQQNQTLKMKKKKNEGKAPQSNVSWPGAFDALKVHGIINDDDSEKLREVLTSLKGYPFLAQWDMDLMNNKPARGIIESPEFIAILRMDKQMLSGNEIDAMDTLSNEEMQKIPEKEFATSGVNGITGKYYRILHLVEFWKKPLAKVNGTKLNKPAPAKLLDGAVHVIEQIALADIQTSKSNPRKSFDEQAIKDLSESLASAGLIQPITLRKAGSKYEIVAGERRYRAAKLLKWKTMDSMVSEITDDEMLEIQIIENLQREDVSPLDEAHAFKTLLQKQDLTWLATRIHKPKKYIAERMKLNDLVEEAADALRLGVLPIGHAVMISKLPFADQQACLSKAIDSDMSMKDYCSITLEALREFIEDSLMLEFDDASFDPNDATLDTIAGACKVCQKRTKNNNLLFDDITEDDRCTDGPCFRHKIELHIAREKEKGKQQYGKVLTGEKNYMIGSDQIKVQGVAVKVQKEPTKNSIPVVITKTSSFSDKKLIGTTVYVDANSIDKKKLDKETEKLDRKSNGGNNYQAQQNKKMRDVIWPRLQMIAGITSFPHSNKILEEYFREQFDMAIEDDLLFALHASLGLNDVTDVEGVIEHNAKHRFANFKEKNQMINEILGLYDDEFDRIYILSLLSNIEGDENKVMAKDSFGVNWKMLATELKLKKPVEKASAVKKAATKAPAAKPAKAKSGGGG